MKTPHALGMVFLAVAATLVIEESRIARLRDELKPLAGAPGKSAASTPAVAVADEGKRGDSAPAKTTREAKPKGDPATASAKGAEDESFTKTVRKMWDNPAGKAMMNQGVKVAVAMMYEDYIEGLNLTKEESDYLKTLLGKDIADQQEIGMKFLGAKPEEHAALMEETNKRKAANEEAIKTFLNDEEDYQNYTTYRDRLPERQQLDGIRAVMNEKGAPLDEATEGKLIEAMFLARTQTDAPDFSGPKAFEEMTKGNLQENFERGWQQQEEKLTAQTSGILNEAQQAAFAEYRKQAKEMQMMGLKMAEQMRSGKKDK
jgi:hypothetical protein